MQGFLVPRPWSVVPTAETVSALQQTNYPTSDRVASMISPGEGVEGWMGGLQT